MTSLCYLSATPLFDIVQNKLQLSRYSIDNADELAGMCDALCHPSSFWAPVGPRYKWDWFAFYGNIDLSISLIPHETDTGIQAESDQIVPMDDDDTLSVTGRNVNLQPFSEIQHFDITAQRRSVVSEYDYRKSQKGRNLHDSMVNLIAQRCVANGASVFSDPKTVDLYAQYMDYEYLIEVKSITPSNFIARLRYAIGQVHQYNFLLPCDTSVKRRLAVAFTADVPSNSWSIPFITEYLSMDLLTLRSSRLKVCSNQELSHRLFA